VIEFDGAEHALHVGTDWRQSIDVLRRTLSAIETLLADRRVPAQRTTPSSG
jgi:hypothetical protein